MSVICPTVLASDPHAFREQIERAAALSDRIQIDFMDGEFAPTKSINLVQAWWPMKVQADIHLMFQRPSEHLETLVSLKPRMVILHAESDGDVGGALEHLKKFNIKTGVALLADTQPKDHAEFIKLVDHVLIFSGSLGSFGGTVNLGLLTKVAEIKRINPTAEIGWDGGANESNVAELTAGGIDVINVGGAIQRSDKPQDAYATLVAKLALHK